MSMRFYLNGQATAYDGDRGRRLADVLRADFGCLGVKLGCDTGDCGACTVMVDGRQLCACLTPVGQVEGALVASVEGLPAYGRLSRIQKAFLKHGGAQCGFCLPGMLMAAADLLAENGRPTEAEVQEALAGVLCRCTGYRAFVAAVLDPDPNPALREGAGGLAQVTGTVRFGADGMPADALWLRVLRPPQGLAAVAVRDLPGWLAGHPGIRQVLTTADLPGNPLPPAPRQGGRQGGRQARWQDGAIAALLGGRAPLQALDPADLPLRFVPGPAAPGRPAARAELRRGDAEAALARAARAGHVAERLVQAAARDGTGFGPEQVWAMPAGEGVEIHGDLRGDAWERDGIARALGLQPGQVRLRPSAGGFGFGRCPDLSRLVMVALAARSSGCPVALLQERRDGLAGPAGEPAARLHARLACDRDGSLAAAVLAVDLEAAAPAEGQAASCAQVAKHACGPYRLPALTVCAAARSGEGPSPGACRGRGAAQAAIAVEAAMDDLAAACDSDRLAFRLRNALRPGDLLATGEPVAGPVGLVACLEALQPHWQAALARAAASNDRAATASAGAGAGSRAAALRHGVGIACGFDLAAALPPSGGRGAAFAAHLVELSVDTELGLVALGRVLAAHDLGRVEDLREAAGQVRGGVARGIGLALMDPWLPGRGGSLRDGPIPTAGDVPPIDCLLVEGPGPAGAAAPKGIGVSGIAAAAAAVLGAIRHATGLPVAGVPALPHRVLAGLQALRGPETDPPVA
ncbi:MAG: molybdopterin-dependent oxidoreductase [Sneathiellaceae bacterium]